MAQSGAIGQLFLLIRSCNRSVPCMEVVSYAVQVLLHVAKVALQFAEQVLTREVRSAMRCPCARPRMSMPSPVRASAGVSGTVFVFDGAFGSGHFLTLASGARL